MTINFHQIKHFVRHFFTAKRKGHGVHSPFAYRLCEDVFYNPEEFYHFEELSKIRSQLRNNGTAIPFEDFGAGSKALNGQQRKISDIVAKGISSQKQSELLYKLCNFLNTRLCIELGTSVGLNTLYLASVNSSAKVITIEGSKALSDFAAAMAQKLNRNNIEFVCARFDQALPGILSKKEKPDLIYVDGNHTCEATINYFELALANKNANTVLVFDDIYWSTGMTKAWNEISKHAEVKMSLDLFYFGIIFFKTEILEPVHLKLYI